MRPAVVALLALMACRRAEPGGTSNASATPYTMPSVPPGHQIVHYKSRGVVKAVGGGAKSVTLEHEDIPNFMKAMTMSFPVSDPRLLDGIGVGDKVSFQFAYDEDDTRMWIESIQRIT